MSQESVRRLRAAVDSPPNPSTPDRDPADIDRELDKECRNLAVHHLRRVRNPSESFRVTRIVNDVIVNLIEWMDRNPSFVWASRAHFFSFVHQRMWWHVRTLLHDQGLRNERLPRDPDPGAVERTPAHAPDGSGSVDDLDLFHRAMQDLRSSMGDDAYTVLNLVEVEGCSYGQVAEFLGWRKNRVLETYRLAGQHLRERFQRSLADGSRPT